MDLSKSKKALKRYEKDLGPAYVDFFVGLWDVQEGIEAVDWEPKNPQELFDAAVDATPMFAIEAPLVTDAFLHENISKVADYIASKVESFAAVAHKIKQVAEAGDEAPALSPEALTRLFVDQSAALEGLAEIYGVEMATADFEYLRLALATAIEPTAVAAAKKLELPEETNFNEGICPVCGSPAPIAIHEDAGSNEGQPRKMWCGLCSTTYRFPRIACARCGNKRQDELTYHFAEGDDNHRVYTCNSCLGTLKVVSERRLDYMPDPRAESVAMVDLEEQVQEELYAAAEAGELETHRA